MNLAFLNPPAALVISLGQRTGAIISIWKYGEEKCNFLNCRLAGISLSMLTPVKGRKVPWVVQLLGLVRGSLIFCVTGLEAQQQTPASVMCIQSTCFISDG